MAAKPNTPQLTPQEIQQQLAHIHDNRSPQVLATTIAFIVLSTLFVLLRILSRRIQRLKLGSDDYWIIASLILAYGMLVTIVYGVHYGIGKHIILAGLVNGPKAARTLYIFEIIFPASNAASKISTLYLYKRLFGNTHSRLFHTSIYLLGLSWTLLYLAGTFSTIFQCGLNFSYAWTTDHSIGCIDISKQVFCLTVTGVIMNGFTLIIPLPFIHSLKLSTMTKLGLFAIFIIGCGDISIAIARAVETAHADLSNLDFTWLQTGVLLLGFVEPCVCIIGTCSILLRPVLLRCHSYFTELCAPVTRKRQQRFPLSTEGSPGASQGRGVFTVPIFLRTRAALSSFSQSVRTGLSGATAVSKSRRDDRDDLEDWELRPAPDQVRSENVNSNVFTHPWQMDTFDRIEKGLAESSDSITARGTPVSETPKTFAPDKPLPPIPDDVSSLTEEPRRSFSLRSFG